MAKNVAIRLLFFGLFILSACTSNKNLTNLNEIINLYKNQDNQYEVKSFTRSEFDNFNYPIIEVRTNGLLVQGLMLPLSERDGYRNYTSGVGQNLTLKGHHLIRTNGMDIFLNSSEIKNINPIANQTPINKWPKNSYRIFKILTPLFSEETVEIKCRFEILNKENITIVEKEYLLNHIIETCQNTLISFQNDFWLTDDGFIWKSKQWIPKKNIYVLINLIKDSYE